MIKFLFNNKLEHNILFPKYIKTHLFIYYVQHNTLYFVDHLFHRWILVSNIFAWNWLCYKLTFHASCGGEEDRNFLLLSEITTKIIVIRKKKNVSKINIDSPKLLLSTCSEKRKQTRYLLMYPQSSKSNWSNS